MEKVLLSGKTHYFQFMETRIPNDPNRNLLFDVEGVLLRSCSVFEAGGPLRAFLLLILYPVICLVGRELGMKIMVFVSFVGLKEENFRIGKTVLPKFFLEDVGVEGFDMVKNFPGKKIGVSEMPRIMVEAFTKDYLRVENVVGRELKLFSGYFTGLMKEKESVTVFSSSDIGICCFKNEKLFSHCELCFLINEGEKRNWNALPREKYLKKLIFHDGRLAFRPTPIAALSMFLWIPFGLLLFMIRLFAALLFPYKVSLPILCFTGISGTTNCRLNSMADTNPKHGHISYVCNHRTVLDPIYVSFSIMKSLTAVTYSISWTTELVSPIKTVRLFRNREKDFQSLEQELKQGDVVIFPEGTTCREPYLLRFSPLFAEVTKEIVPVAIDVRVGMFYGTTASGFKAVDPVFLLMNPWTHCCIKFLPKLPETETCQGGHRSKIEVANHVQEAIAEALGFECTSLTRRDKYRILAGNEGLI